ncbi:MAG: substrate-binding domain-containing protein [Lentisphaeria bacterium]|nr:substrate-binding domain-containing protein [Lentisphaeria bacterium]
MKKCGHRKIGYLGKLSDPRVRQLVSEAKRCGLKFHERWQIGFPDSQQADCGRMTPANNAFALLRERNRGKDLPTALIFNSDSRALNMMHCIRECGFRIPEDFSIIGHGNIPYCITTVPALTSMSEGTPDEIAESLVCLLMEWMENPGKPREKVLLKAELIERESVLNLRNKP